MEGMKDERTDLICPDCGALMVLRSSKYGVFYGCSTYPACRSAHGAHKDGGAPLGIPANKETKDWRIKAHNAFDQLWKVKGMKRKDAYRWMREAMSLPKEDCHIGRFNIDQCNELIGLVFQKLRELMASEPEIEV